MVQSKEYLGNRGLSGRLSSGTGMPADNDCNHILVIDDSNQICSMLVTGIVRACAESGRTCDIIQSGPFGLMETMPMNFSHNVFDNNFVVVYTANMPKHALPVLRLPGIKQLTIICDIMMPADTEVGLFGLLSELSRLKLPVNLVFATGEGQNRQYVEELIRNRKAYFLEKGTAYWGELPYALVQKSELFKYQVVVQTDFDKGRMGYRPQPATVRTVTGTGTLPSLETPIGHVAVAPVRPASPVSPAPVPTVLATPSPAPARPMTTMTVAVAEVPAVRPVAPPSPVRPGLKSSTGLLSVLTFWRRWTSPQRG